MAKSFASTTLKVVGGATTAIAAGLTAVGKSALESYADYEQLVGGVETLFGAGGKSIEEYAESAGKTVDEVRNEYDNLLTAQKTVLEDADNAFRDAGVSANDYMENVTGFSAALISSLGGDTTEAARLSNMAMVDMADNANKMGTDIESIQHAYQGFAKQNYTMLDNLKLGYGGTTTEMDRLMQDAAALNEEFQLVVDGNGDLVYSFDDIVNAIHIVQSEMGITGTTALEAETTISGSIGMLKASIENLMVGFGNADADITELCDNVVDSFFTVVDNVTPIVENIIETLPEVLMRLIEKVGDLLPTLLETVTRLFSESLSMFVSLIPQLVPAVTQAVMTVTQTLVDNLPAIISAAGQIISSLGSGIMNALPNLLAPATEALLMIVRGLVDSIPYLLEAAVQIIEALVDYVLTPANIFEIIIMADEVVLNLVRGLLDAIPRLIDAAAELVLGLVEYWLDPETMSEFAAVAVETVITLAGGLITGAVHLIGAVVQLISDILYAFGDTDWISVGKNIIDGMLTGLKNAWESLTEWIDNSLERLVDGVKDFLGINSPSKLFAEIGGNMALGIGVGWDDSFDDVKSQIDDDMVFDSTLQVDGTRSVSGKSKGVSVVQNIYAQKMTPSEVFEEAKYQQTKAVLFGV